MSSAVLLYDCAYVTLRDIAVSNQGEIVGETYEALPDALEGREYYTPTKEGDEAKVREKLEHVKEWKKKLHAGKGLASK